MAEERKIKGFGAKAGGKKLLHVICEDGGALCDKRLSGFGKVTTFLKEVTCPKCKDYSVYKALMAGFIVGDDLNEIKKVLEERKPNEPEKDKEQSGKGGEFEKGKVSNIVGDGSNGKPKTGTPKTTKKKPAAKKKEPVYPPKGPLDKKKKEKEKPKPIKVREDWNLLWDEEKTFCDILHKPTQKVFFEGIKSNIALIALENLNGMKIFWSPGESIPKEFVSTARSIVGKAYKKTGNKIPENLVKPSTKKKGKGETKDKDKKDKPTGRTIKRRGKPKKEARVISRRSPKKEKETRRVIKRRVEKEVHAITRIFGRREGTAGFMIIQLLDEGMTLRRMVKQLMRKHSLTEPKAKSKIKTVIRKTARKKGVPIIIKLAKEEKDDLYGLAEDIE